MDKSWHPEHFQCYGCLVQFSGSMSYREKDSHPYCDSCYTDLVLPKCGGCGKPITDRALKAFDTQWHVSCFVCAVRNISFTSSPTNCWCLQECKTTFEGSKNFYSVEGQPVCGACAGVTDENEWTASCFGYKDKVDAFLSSPPLLISVPRMIAVT